jgi:hypothetical protein
MLIFVGWCSVVVWLNVRPRIDDWPHGYRGDVIYYKVEYGFPWSYAFALQDTTGFCTNCLFFPFVHWRLVGDAAIGLLAVTVLTCGSSYLLRRITSWIATHGRKSSPPDS